MNVTEPAVPQAVSARRDSMSARRQRSLLWRIIYFCGSLKLALILLATIALACAIATFTESGFTTKIAQAYIYKAPWFLVWLAVLCLNLFCVTVTRWPWQKKHYGFIITHYGIITLLAGAVIGMHAGFEGNIVLHTNTPPVSRITTNRSIIQLESPADASLYTMPFDAELARLGNGRTHTFDVPDTQFKVIADEFSPNIVQEPRLVPDTSPSAGPAVLLRFSSQMMGQNLSLPFVLAGDTPAEQDFFGLARVIFRSSLPDQMQEVPRETQMVFSRYSPVITGPVTTGVTVRLSTDGETIAILDADGTGATFLRKEVLGKPLNEAGAVIVVEKYWPDFVMKNGEPSTRSDEPKNPAILVHLTKVSAADRKPLLTLAPHGDSVVYQLSRGGQIYSSGTAKVGESFALGWADWQAKVAQFFPQAIVVSDAKPGPPLAKGAQGIPGFRVHLLAPDGKSGPDTWVESGRVVTLTGGMSLVRFGYGLETKPLPFSMTLLKFEVPRDEGTDTPSNFLATVEFRDAKTGQTKIAHSRMNHPASFPGTLWANFTGFNYKFSQAQWNPRDLGETTLQVLYDPGWLLKWIGSLGIVIGIATMFYGKPKKDLSNS